MFDKNPTHQFKPIRECCPDQREHSRALYEAICSLVVEHGQAHPDRSTCAVVSAMTNCLNDVFLGAGAGKEENCVTDDDVRMWRSSQMVRVVQAIEQNMPGLVKFAAVQVAISDIRKARGDHYASQSGYDTSDLLAAWKPTGPAN